MTQQQRDTDMSSDGTSTTAHDFDAAIALASSGDNEAQGQTHPAYGNMVGPFGGVKQSGLGREGSKYGIEEYLEIKYLCVDLGA